MKVSTCRLCKNGSLGRPLLDFGSTPLANEFLHDRVKQDLFPLQVCVCELCGHYQLNEAVSPERMFRHYVYVAGTSSVNVKHFSDYADLLVSKFGVAPGSKVLDIASNDGTMLKQFQRLGMKTLGIDPAKNLADAANAEGVETIAEFFTSSFANSLLQSHGQFDLVTANNVFAHVPDLEDFAKGVQKILAPGGVFSFEVSYFLDVCEKTLFDTVYHEHTSYHTIKPLISFFLNLGMDLFHVQRIPNHGGSIRCFVQHLHGARYKSDVRISQEMDMDRKVHDLSRDVRILGLELREKLRELKSQGKSIAVYGTPAKATTLTYALGIDERFVDFAVDDNPLKQGTYLPGHNIQVIHPKLIFERKPDYLLVLAWNFADSIIQNHSSFEGKWIVPLPELRVVDSIKENLK